MRTRITLAFCLLTACAKGGPAQTPATPAPAPAPEPAPAPAADKAPPAPPDDGEVTITTSSAEAREHFKTGRDLFDNQRAAESVEHFKKALELDPGFAQATSYLALVSPGPAVSQLEKAVEQAKGAPEPERMMIESRLAFAKGDSDKGKELLHKVVEARPKDWRAQLRLAEVATGDENWDEAVSASDRALKQNPNAFQAYNTLAYGYAWQGRYPDAIEVAKKQIEALPAEPNPHDTLGEVLLAANKLDEALAEFQKAGAMSPSFAPAFSAAGVTRAYKGDWKGAYDELKKGHDGAARTVDAIDVAVNEAWLRAAQGKLPDALKIYDAVDAKTAAEKLEVPRNFFAVNRALLLAYAGKPKDALKAIDAAQAGAAAATLPPLVQREIANGLLQARLIVDMKTKKGADAEKHVAALEAELKKLPMNRGSESGLAYGQGLAAWAKGDAKGAAAAMGKCSQLDYPCRFMLVGALRAAGDKAGATDLMAKLKASPRRETAYAYFYLTMK